MHEFSENDGQRTYYRFEQVEYELYPNTTHDTDLRASQQPLVGPEYSPASAPKAGFWRRQFQSELSGRQKKFDVIFGFALPLVCFFFDPIVFKSDWGANDGILTKFTSPAYLLAFTAIMATMASLLFGPKLKWANAFLPGTLAVSFVASLVVGIVLAPFSLMGIVLLIGLLGFTPLFTSFVFLRHSIRTLRAAKPLLERGVLIHSWILGAMATVAFGYVSYVWTR